MNEARFTWLERTSKSEFIASVWACSASATTTRAVLADPCISIALVKESGRMQVFLRGPETKPRTELLVSGYTCLTIRLQPGVLLQGFSAQKFINSSLTLPVDTEGLFWLGGNFLQFPDFDNVELLIDQLYSLGYLRHGLLSSNEQAGEILSIRSYFRLITRTTGLSPYQLYQLQRIHKALRLVKGGIPATMVATELNFADQSHLTHASKQFLGYTPKQFLSLPQIP